MMALKSSLASVTVSIGLLTLAGCAGPALPPPPNLYIQGEATKLRDISPQRQTVDIDMLYATDRMPVEEESSSTKVEYYDERRSNSLALGHVIVRPTKYADWESFTAADLDPKAVPIDLELTTVQEIVRWPSSIALPVKVDGKLQADPKVLAQRADTRKVLHDELKKRLASTPRKEVFIYIHGVGNSFEDPMHRMASLWHYMGRPGVPVVYSWPSIKGGGPLRGYTYARESSEFTVFHLRQFLQAVAMCDEVERIHILAHSRGTGVTLSVLRDLRLIYKDDADKALEEMKLGNVILAAPDIDLMVAQQRFRPDNVNEIMQRMTLYVTPEDKALGIAEFLFSSLTRLGAVTKESFSAEQRQALKDGRVGVDLIDVKVKKKGAHGHTYWVDNPSVFSDVILILRDDRSAGKEHGRPLIRADSGMWEVHDGYPYGGPHAEDAKAK